ncbi:hypothetical protein COO60DRAFT_1465381 [Scenedesmus sp. NREL 46B-D3]|nr:hypothetical protein COO60DRAFT_1465381 [Scenedesmus sp. NREL 46B-D3]
MSVAALKLEKVGPPLEHQSCEVMDALANAAKEALSKLTKKGDILLLLRPHDQEHDSKEHAALLLPWAMRFGGVLFMAAAYAAWALQHDAEELQGFAIADFEPQIADAGLCSTTVQQGAASVAQQLGTALQGQQGDRSEYSSSQLPAVPTTQLRPPSTPPPPGACEYDSLKVTREW